MSFITLKTQNIKHQHAGFSILEISIALTVMAFLVFGLANTIKTERDTSAFKETRLFLQNAKNALVTFTQTNGYMPCPDSVGFPDGLEDRSSGRCNIVFGRFPHLTLNMPSKDVWGNNLYYSIVTNADSSAFVGDADRLASYFNSSATPFFTLNTPPVEGGSVAGALRVCGENAVACNGATATENMIELSAVAVLVSFGKNGANTWTNLDDAAVLANKELENTDPDSFFWKARGSYLDDEQYDDQLVWVNGIELKAAMLKSQLGIND